MWSITKKSKIDNDKSNKKQGNSDSAAVNEIVKIYHKVLF